MSNILDTLTEGMIQKDQSREAKRLEAKWEKTGLLEGLENDYQRDGMSLLLENQARELLREASTMAGGDVEGFAAVAFPIVRRVFGNLIANELVSVQPMNLPSGLIFFLDFTYTNSRLDNIQDGSIYGQGRVASEITGGVLLNNDFNEQSAYNLNNGYSLPTASFTVTTTLVDSGTVGAGDDDLDALVQYDPDLSGSLVAVASIPLSDFDSAGNELQEDDFVAIHLTDLASGRQIRRQTRFSGSSQTVINVVAEATGSMTLGDLTASLDAVTAADAPIADNFDPGGAIGSVVGADVWGLEADEGIPEIDIKVDSVSITAVTRKLKAKWSPELGQDLNAYHNLDAEVELTSILSEHVELEINMEIMEDLLKGATAAIKFWSRKPGKFVDPDTGQDISNTTAPPDFTGNVSEWYETLMERVNEVNAVMVRKLRRGGANFMVTSPEIANLLEFTMGMVGNVAVENDKGSAGTRKAASINGKYDVYVDPYFPRQLILLGRKGSGFLESGYVYAPYVPMQMTPTIFGTEDFVPRKGIMTRYGKKMVRPDMYGVVVVQDLAGPAR